MLLLRVSKSYFIKSRVSGSRIDCQWSNDNWFRTEVNLLYPILQKLQISNTSRLYFCAFFHFVCTSQRVWRVARERERESTAFSSFESYNKPITLTQFTLDFWIKIYVFYTLHLKSHKTLTRESYKFYPPLSLIRSFRYGYPCPGNLGVGRWHNRVLVECGTMKWPGSIAYNAATREMIARSGGELPRHAPPRSAESSHGCHPFVFSKHVIVTGVSPTVPLSPCPACHHRNVHDTRNPRVVGEHTLAWNPRAQEGDDSRETLDLCLLILKIGRFPPCIYLTLEFGAV